MVYKKKHFITIRLRRRKKKLHENTTTLQVQMFHLTFMLFTRSQLRITEFN